MSEKQTCPRRMGELGPWDRQGDLDSWVTGRGLVGVQGDNLSCSFCGSLHPDTFMEWVEAAGKVVPTDKNYKAYIACPHDNPRYGEQDSYVIEGTNTTVHTSYGREAKFYFKHLSSEQMQRFVELYNERRITFGEPGDFYRFPFFMAPVDPEPEST